MKEITWDCRTRELLLGFPWFVLLWFSIWTATVNSLVLMGTRFFVLPWCLATTTILALLAFSRLSSRIFSDVALFQTAARLKARSFKILPIGLVGLSVIGVAVNHFVQSSSLLTFTAVCSSIGAYLLSRATQYEADECRENLTADFLVVLCIVAMLYYFGHRPDWDDANYLNMAAKAPLTHGKLLELDTMVGDGPHPIHLPTYKLHSYELLGAVIAHVASREPIEIMHLWLPAVLLLLFVCVLALVLRPPLGRQWVAASLFSLGFLYANSTTFTSWGMNGLARFHQGKGALVIIIPLAAAGLTSRWFKEERRLDLLALALLHISAIGLSANGLFVSPAASGLVAGAFVSASPTRNWRPALQLAPTLVYPVLIAIVLVAKHLALPSEATSTQFALNSLMGVIGWRAEGIALLALMPLLPLVALRVESKLAAATYLPLALVLTLSPIGWRLISAATGNLGFRIFWAIPGVFVAGAVAVRVFEYAGFASRPWVMKALGISSLCVGLLWNERQAQADQRIQWHLPDVRVTRPDYDMAVRLAALTPSGCKALVPAQYAVWMSGLKKGPYLIVVESLYLRHYRFSEPQDELATRWTLFNLINGIPTDVAALSPSRLRSFDMAIGLIASDRNNANLRQIKSLADSLGMRPLPAQNPSLVVWRGQCHESAPADRARPFRGH